MIPLLILITGVIYAAWSAISMELNHRRAQRMSIPLIRLPVDPTNIFWILLEPYLWRLLDILPIHWGNTPFGHYSRRGWFFADKASSHVRYGPVFALATPRDIYVYVADPEAVHEIFMRREDFLRPSRMYSM